MGNTLIEYGYAQRKRDGGIILARRIAHGRLERILRSDPFAEQQLARYELTEFKTTRLAPGLNLPIPD
nr:hypothetical protein [Paraburkholderia sp. HP33-1]